jgi:HK97 gp10 family phage protein
MGVPSVVRVTRNGIEFTSSIDRTKYLLSELERAALREVGKFIRKIIWKQARLQAGLRKGKRISNAFQFWVRKRETDLQIGIKANTWYGVDQELGTKKQPRRAILSNAVMNNIDDIQRIMAVYLKYVEDEQLALQNIDENDEGNAGDSDG